MQAEQTGFVFCTSQFSEKDHGLFYAQARLIGINLVFNASEHQKTEASGSNLDECSEKTS